MKRLLVLTLLASVVNTSAAFAGETLLQSATRHAREAARTAVPTVPAGQRPVLAQSQSAPGLEASGMSKGRKILIALAVGVAAAATMYTIDHKVEDNTPSSHGLREDGL